MNNNLISDTGAHLNFPNLNLDFPVGRAIGLQDCLEDPVPCPNYRLFITKDNIMKLQREIIGSGKAITWVDVPTVYEEQEIGI